MELDEHVPVYVPKPEHPEYHAPSDDDIQDGDDEPSDDDNDDDDTDDEDAEPTEDEGEEEHLALADPSAIPIVDPVPSARDTEAFKTDESVPTPRSPQTMVLFSQTRLRRAWKTVRLEPPMSASMKARITKHVAAPIPPTSPAYDQAPVGHRATMIHMRDDIPEEDMPPRRRFILTAPSPGCDVAESSAAAAAGRPPRGQYDFVDTVETRQGSIRSPGHDARTIARAADRAEDVGYIELHEVRQAYLSFEARNRALLARLETLETHMSRMEWQRQRAEDDAVRQMMCIHVLEARAQIDTVEDTDGSSYTRRFQELALMFTKFLADETEKVDKYISGLPDNIHGNVMSARPKTLDDAIELANDLMDQKLRTYAERQSDNKRKADDSSRNNQQPHKKQNVARAYTAGPGEKKAYTGNLPLCTKCDYHHTRNVHPSMETARGACYECGNTGHIKKNFPKLKNRGNGNENGTAQGRAYALGGRDDSPDSNVITGTFLLNNHYATILFDTGANRSFVSNTFSALINIIPTTFESHYDVELADGKIIGVNTIIRGCTLNFMNHPFNIDLIPVPFGSFDVIIGMDCLTKYHGVIIYDEKIVRAPSGREMLIFQGNGNNQREESRLNIILCTKAQEYLSKGCDVFLAHITTKEAKDKSEVKRLEDVPDC
ncbi:putative reverse transcriptase domain-containing protein [Tanacetum coccineum]